MITADKLERLRPATIDDVGGILQLIEPLEEDGTLVRRGRELLEREIQRFVVLEHDKLIVGCAALYPFPKVRAGELACLAVRPDLRGAGHGEGCRSPRPAALPNQSRPRFPASKPQAGPRRSPAAG